MRSQAVFQQGLSHQAMPGSGQQQQHRQLLGRAYKQATAQCATRALRALRHRSRRYREAPPSCITLHNGNVTESLYLMKAVPLARSCVLALCITQARYENSASYSPFCQLEYASVVITIVLLPKEGHGRHLSELVY